MPESNRIEASLCKPALQSAIAAPRLLIIDPNITGLKGHFLELAIVIADSAKKQGYRCEIATSRCLCEEKFQSNGHTIRPVLSCPKIRRWSLGPHGYSRVSRDLDGRPVGGNAMQRVVQRLIDLLHGQSPQSVVDITKMELLTLVEDFKPHGYDHVLFSTSDDFVVLVAASAFSNCLALEPFRVSFLWHAPVVAGRIIENKRLSAREVETSAQLNLCIRALEKYGPRFLATTEELKLQYESRLCLFDWTAVDYPIRASCSAQVEAERTASGNEEAGLNYRSHRGKAEAIDRRPVQLICGGALRSEKGVKLLKGVTRFLWDQFLASGKVQLGLQVDAATAEKLSRMAARLGHDSLSLPPFNFSKQSLEADEYLDRIRSADIGMFLYDSRRYYTRCSGVLIEMLCCGKPVLVPAGCWLSRQIAIENFRYIEVVDRQTAGKGHSILNNSQLATVRSRGTCLKINGFDSGVTLSMRFKNASDHSYVAIESSSHDAAGDRLSCLHILEILGNQSRIILRPLPGSVDQSNLSLCIWSPYKEPGLVIEDISYKSLLGQTLASDSIGRSFARMRDLPAFLSEMIFNYDSYKTNTSVFKQSFSAKHSGDAFATKLLQ